MDTVTVAVKRNGKEKSVFYNLDTILSKEYSLDETVVEMCKSMEFLDHQSPRPWRYAKPGEIWDVTTDAGENRMIVWDVGGQFTFVKVELHGPAAIPILSEKIKHAVLKLGARCDS